MTVVDFDKIDAIGVTEDNPAKMTLMISDHLDWQDIGAHLICLQEKINAYLYFVQEKQYESMYPHLRIKDIAIQINFLYDIPAECKKFLKTVQRQIKGSGVVIRTVIRAERS